MKPESWEQVANVIFNRDHIQYVMHDSEDSRTVYMRFADGFQLTFKGDDAVEVWQIFSDEKGWRGE